MVLSGLLLGLLYFSATGSEGYVEPRRLSHIKQRRWWWGFSANVQSWHVQIFLCCPAIDDSLTASP